MEVLNTKKIGNIAEDQACDYLQKHGLILITRNFRCALGEIDLIMRDQEDIVFIEVRSQHKNFSDAFESVDHHKQTKLVKAATFYLQKEKLFDKINCRFDVIGIHNNNLEWIKDAFFIDHF
jgi:putative endonuclease